MTSTIRAQIQSLLDIGLNNIGLVQRLSRLAHQAEHAFREAEQVWEPALYHYSLIVSSPTTLPLPELLTDYFG